MDGKAYSRCQCRTKNLREARLRVIPPLFRDARLTELRPDAEKHPRQASLINAAKADPDGSYFLAGRSGTGKSHVMWALYRHAVEQGDRTVVACTMTQLLDEYRAFISAVDRDQRPVYPRLSVDDLTDGKRRYAVFLDDIDKANPTAYAGEKIFAIVNAICEFQHQLVVTTNKTPEELIAFYNRSDDTRGPAIVRRMMEGANVVKMF